MQKPQILATLLDAVGLCVYANDLDEWSDWFKNKKYRKDFWIFFWIFFVSNTGHLRTWASFSSVSSDGIAWPSQPPIHLIVSLDRGVHPPLSHNLRNLELAGRTFSAWAHEVPPTVPSSTAHFTPWNQQDDFGAQVEAGKGNDERAWGGLWGGSGEGKRCWEAADISVVCLCLWKRVYRFIMHTYMFIVSAHRYMHLYVCACIIWVGDAIIRRLFGGLSARIYDSWNRLAVFKTCERVLCCTRERSTHWVSLRLFARLPLSPAVETFLFCCLLLTVYSSLHCSAVTPLCLPLTMCLFLRMSVSVFAFRPGNIVVQSCDRIAGLSIQTRHMLQSDYWFSRHITLFPETTEQ